MKIQAPDAWTFAGGGGGVLIAVLDTGIDDTNPSLRGKIVDRVNFTQSSAKDINGHGTYIAGIIAAAKLDSPILGVSYNCKLLDVKVAEDSGFTDFSKVAKGILWAADHGANVINLSLVINREDPSLEAAVNYAWEKGCTLVAAAGNIPSSNKVYPAAYAVVLAVVASDKDDKLAKWSNRGDWVDVMAPGVEIYSISSDNRVISKSGTSCSAALVSGEAAILYTKIQDTNGNGFKNDELIAAIISGCDQSSGGSVMGRINVFKSVEVIKK
ncbi:hypothetical protein FJZ31_43225 [Candidatus Poribacteria bacterium]|nr:hypothetical protein [Candidatus Poribacteria bacterium]